MIRTFRHLPALILLFAAAGLSSPTQAARPDGRLPDDGRGRTADGRRLGTRGELAAWRGPADARATRSWRRLTDEIGPAWASWEPTTGVPRQIVTRGTAAPGTTASAAAAERFAAALIERHLDVLAPGAKPGDLKLVSHDLSNGMRTLGWVQHDGGRPVVGGQVSVRLAHDHLVAIASSAWPHLSVPAAASPITDDDARDIAEAWLHTDVPGRATADAVSEPVVLPIAGPTGIEAHEALEVQVHVDAPRSEWIVWLDTQTGAPLARRQTLTFAAGTVLYDVPERGPLAPRVDLPVPDAQVIVDGLAQLTDELGAVTFGGPTAAVLTGLSGPYVQIINAAGELADETIFVADGGAGVWSAADDELVDAQLSAFVHASVAKSYVRAIAPDLAWLDQTINVTVNIDDECNANSDGDSINFYRASEACENTGRLADVVYHELGHSVHHQSLIPGVGSFDVALSEGTSDYLSATMTGDSGLARGFFYDDTPLRELDPDGYEYRWPEDNGEVHAAGRIIGGALWDLRKILIGKHGPEIGVQLTDRIWYEATRRAVDIPSMYVEALVVDDDDGDIGNGTPNACEINAAFGPHGLFTPGEAGEQVLQSSIAGGTQIDLLVALPSFPGCPVDAEARVEWRLRDAPGDSQTITMTPAEGGFTTVLPPATAGSVVQYRVLVSYSNGAERSLPENLADPWYELFVGEVTPIWCTSFESDREGFSLQGEFGIGTPPGESSVDPTAAWGADPFVLGVALGGVGEYAPWATSTAVSPVIEVPPGFSSVRLQYRRWLSVEDGFFDQAWLLADGDTAWGNYTSEDEKLANVHHRDREWRFHDVDLTAASEDGAVQIELGIASDGGLQFGGWTVDELCIVGFDAAAATCGNGIIEAGEECDDGNADASDGCDACFADGGADGGGGGGDGGGEDPDDDDDDGPRPGDAGLDGDGFVDRGCACRSAPDRSGPSPASWWVALVAIARRRRR